MIKTGDNNMKQKLTYDEIKNEIEKRYDPIIRHLIDDHNNEKMANSNLDMAWENIREIMALTEMLNNYKKDLTTFTRIIKDDVMEREN